MIHYKLYVNCLSDLWEIVSAYGVKDAFLPDLENTRNCMTLQPKCRPAPFLKDAYPQQLLSFFPFFKIYM